MKIQFSTFTMDATLNNNNTLSINCVKDSENNFVMLWAENMVRLEVLKKFSNRILTAIKNSVKMLDLNVPEKEIKVIPTIKDINDLQNLINKSVSENKEFDLKNLKFMTSKSSMYIQKYSRIKEDLGKYLILEKTFNTEDSDKIFIITYKVRYIKSRDKMNFINIETIEVI